MQDVGSRADLGLFFLLAFGISWGVPGALLALSAGTGAFEVSLAGTAPLAYVAIWAPALAAVAVVGLRRGGAGLRAFGRRLLRWGADARWSIAVLAGVPLGTLLAGALMELAGREWLAAPEVGVGAFLGTALRVGTQGPVEEIGWRGFALPALHQRYSGLSAAILLGFVWALWHVPGFFVESVMTDAMLGSVALVLAQNFVGIVARSVIMTVVFNATRGSVPLAFLLHWLSNLPYPWEARPGIAPTQPLLLVAIALVLVALFRRRYLARENLHTEVLAEGGRPGGAPGALR